MSYFIDHGEGSRLVDIDGNEYIDFHLGYGAMVVGHAHPKIVEAIQRQAAKGTHFAQPTKDLDVSGENLSDRFKLPLWRFANSGTESTLEAIRLVRANTGRDMIVKIEGSYHGHHDSIMFSVAPDPSEIGPREHPVTVHQAMGSPGVRGPRASCAVQRPYGGAPRLRGEPGQDRRHVVEPAMMNCGVIMPESGYLQGLKDLCHEQGAYLDLRRGQDGCDPRVRRGDRGVRRRTGHGLPREGHRGERLAARSARPRTSTAGDPG